MARSLSAIGRPRLPPADSGMMTCMVQKAGRPSPETPAVTRLGEEDWRIYREVRLAALADAPASFAPTLEEEQAIHEDGWRTMVRDGAIFVATAEGTAVGAVAGLYRASAQERGLGAMWVAPQWRGQGVAALLAAAVISWARSEGASTVGLWVSGDNPRARRFYENQGFRATGRRRPFPGDSSRRLAIGGGSVR
jgi:GNAT superfamily N-acetyltransferase